MQLLMFGSWDTERVEGDRAFGVEAVRYVVWGG